jgi:hypothetical protein
MDEPQDNELLLFVTIRPEVMRALKISANEYMVLDTVYHLSRKHGYCYKSIGNMATDLALPKMTVKSIIDRLMIRGLLGRSAAGLTIGQAYADVAYVSTKTVQPSTKIVRPRTKIVPTVRKSYDRTKSAPKNYIKKDIEAKSTNVLVDSAKPKTTTGKSYRQMFEELVSALGYDQPSRVKPLDSRIRKLKSRLKQFTYDEILTAARTLGADDFMQGENDGGKRYGDIDHLLKKDEIIDKWLNKAQAVAMVSKVDWA